MSSGGARRPAPGRHARVALLDQEPVLLRAALLVARPHADERPAAAQAAAVQGELERALPAARARVAVRPPPAAGPEHDAPGPVVPFRDHALEPAVLDRMILDVHRQPLLAWHRLRLLGNGPALEHPVPLHT